MENKRGDNRAAAEIINLAYYYIFGASILVSRFERMFREAGADEKGMIRLRVNGAKENIRSAINQLNTFDDTFVRACEGDGDKWNAFLKVSQELIALNLLYLGHSYENPRDAAEVFKLIGSHGNGNEVIDKLSDEYFLKAMTCK